MLTFSTPFGPRDVLMVLGSCVVTVIPRLPLKCCGGDIHGQEGKEALSTIKLPHLETPADLEPKVTQSTVAPLLNMRPHLTSQETKIVEVPMVLLNGAQFGRQKRVSFAENQPPLDDSWQTPLHIEDDDDDTPLLDREVTLEEKDWKSPCPFAYRSTTDSDMNLKCPHPILTMKGLFKKRHRAGKSKIYELPITEYSINCLKLDEGVLETALLIRGDIKQFDTLLSMVLNLEAPDVPTAVRRREFMTLRVVHKESRTEDRMEIGLEFIEEVNLYDDDRIRMVFQGMRVDVVCSPSSQYIKHQLLT